MEDKHHFRGMYRSTVSPSSLIISDPADLTPKCSPGRQCTAIHNAASKLSQPP